MFAIKNSKHKFEIPYNFDKNLITGLKILEFPADNIYCIYVSPIENEYKSTFRGFNGKISSIEKEAYIDHINFINENYPNKLQLLLQQTDGTLMSAEQLQFYIDLGFQKFCCGTLEQGKILKQINPNFEIIGSITMHITKNDIEQNYYEYQQIFDGFVLDFKYNKNIQLIKTLPQGFNYILLINALCHKDCKGDHHWFLNDYTKKTYCPDGLHQNRSFYDNTLIRPMDLKYFDPYIKVYKFQDRGWATPDILQDIVLFNSNYDKFPNILYDEDIYEGGIKSKFFD